MAKKKCEQCGILKINIPDNRKICYGCRTLNYRVGAGQVREPDYPEVNTTNYKDPMQKVEDGFGYYGAITVTNDNKQIQCHLCGYFYPNLGAHIRAKHFMKPRDYKMKYGLRLNEGLLSPVQLKTAQDIYNKYSRKSPEEYAEMSKKAQAALMEKREDGYMPGGNTWADITRNEKGNCKEQTIAKIQLIAARNEGVATWVAFTQEYGAIDTVIHWFGSWQAGCKAAGVPSGMDNIRHNRDQRRRDILKALKKFYKEQGRTPLSSDLTTENNLPSYSSIQKSFGTLNKARVAAGIPELLYLKGKWLEVVEEAV